MYQENIMIKMTRTYSRPSVDIEWHIYVLDSAWVGPYINETYKNTGKLLGESIGWSDSFALSIEYVAYWLDNTSFEEYNYDSTLIPYWQERDVYNASVGITITPQVITEE